MKGSRMIWSVAALSIVLLGLRLWQPTDTHEQLDQAVKEDRDTEIVKSPSETRGDSGSRQTARTESTASKTTWVVEDETRTRNSELEARLAAVERQLEQARKELGNKEAEVAYLDQTIQDMLIAALTLDKEQRPSTLEGDGVMRSSIGDQEAPLWDRLNTEALDPDWANAQSDRLLGLINGEFMTGTGLVDMQCGASLCRIETVHESEAALDSLLDTLGSVWGLQYEHFIAETPFEEGGKNAVVYYSRDGYSLPSTLQ